MSYANTDLTLSGPEPQVEEGAPAGRFAQAIRGLEVGICFIMIFPFAVFAIATSATDR